MAERSRPKSKRGKQFPILQLPPEDPLSDMLKVLLSDLQSGDLPLDPASEQVMYYDKFLELFGLSQNRKTATQRIIEEETKCKLRPDFRVRTVELIGENEGETIQGWTRVLDKLCKLPSLRPKRYIVVDRNTHKPVQGLEKIAAESPKDGNLKHEFPNLSTKVISHLHTHKVLNQLQTALAGTATLTLSGKLRSMTITAHSQADLDAAKTICEKAISELTVNLQCIYLAFQLPPDFYQSLVSQFLPDWSGGLNDLCGSISLGKVDLDSFCAFSSLQPKLYSVTSGFPITIGLETFVYQGKTKRVKKLHLKVAQLEQVHSLQTLISEHMKSAYIPSGAEKLMFDISSRTGDKLTLSNCTLSVPDTLESSLLCVGTPGSEPGIELSLV